MEHIKVNLQQYDDLANSALDVLRQMPHDSQERLLHHLFRVVTHVDRTDDVDAAVRLCKDLASTIRLHQNDTYHKATLGMAPSGDSVSIEDVLARFR